QPLLANASVFAFPSECEGFAKVTLEAAACALPLIATRERGDEIVDGATGRANPPNDPESNPEAILEARDAPDRCARVGRSARALVESRFTWDRFRQRVIDGYRKAMAMAG